MRVRPTAAGLRLREPTAGPWQQSIYFVPEFDLVVVVTAGYRQDYSPRAVQVQCGISRDVVRGDFASGLNWKAALHWPADGGWARVSPKTPLARSFQRARMAASPTPRAHVPTA